MNASKLEWNRTNKFVCLAHAERRQYRNHQAVCGMVRHDEGSFEFHSAPPPAMPNHSLLDRPLDSSHSEENYDDQEQQQQQQHKKGGVTLSLSSLATNLDSSKLVSKEL